MSYVCGVWLPLDCTLFSGCLAALYVVGDLPRDRERASCKNVKYEDYMNHVVCYQTFFNFHTSRKFQNLPSFQFSTHWSQQYAQQVWKFNCPLQVQREKGVVSRTWLSKSTTLSIMPSSDIVWRSWGETSKGLMYSVPPLVLVKIKLCDSEEERDSATMQHILRNMGLYLTRSVIYDAFSTSVSWLIPRDRPIDHYRFWDN